jgi:hypothetical protein
MQTRRVVTRDGGWMAAVLIALLLAGPVRAEQTAATSSDDSESNTDLAKKTQNPVADLISVPFQNNFNFNTGPEKRSVWVLNVQPVVPIKLTDDWNLITRTVVPIINQPPLAPGVDQATGLGDIAQEAEGGDEEQAARTRGSPRRGRAGDRAARVPLASRFGAQHWGTTATTRRCRTPRATRKLLK